MHLFNRDIDLSKVRKLVYHLPDGETYILNVQNLEELYEIGLEEGSICDTSEIDGVIHFFPHGHA